MCDLSCCGWVCDVGCWEYMSPVSPVFHTVVTVRLISKMSVTSVNKTGPNQSCSTDVNCNKLAQVDHSR